MRPPGLFVYFNDFLTESDSVRLLFLCKTMYFFLKDPAVHPILLLKYDPRMIKEDRMKMTEEHNRKHDLSRFDANNCVDYCCVVECYSTQYSPYSDSLGAFKCCFCSAIACICFGVLMLSFSVAIVTDGSLDALSPEMRWIGKLLYILSKPEGYIPLLGLMGLMLCCSIIRPSCLHFQKKKKLELMETKLASKESLYGFFQSSKKARCLSQSLLEYGDDVEQGLLINTESRK